MATGKKYFWIKLKDSFMTSDTVDYFMSQPNGANYVVLYQMLCLKTINTEGHLSRQIGEVIIPYDIGKIKRDCKWFSEDTIRVALKLYESFGLIYEDSDGTLVLTDHANLVGMGTDFADQKRKQRALTVDNVHSNVHSNVHQNVHTEIRDKRLDIRDKISETELDNKSTKEVGIGCGEGEETSLPSPPEPQAEAKPKLKSKPKDVQNIELYSKIDVIPLYGFSESLFAKIAEWLTYKGQNGETYKEVGLKALLSQIRKNCDSYGESAVSNLIDECMAAGYKGIIFDRLKKPRGAPKDSHEAYVEKWRNI